MMTREEALGRILSAFAEDRDEFEDDDDAFAKRLVTALNALNLIQIAPGREPELA